MSSAKCVMDEAARFFRNVPSVSDKLNAMLDVGLGYLRLGQAATTLSGGEAQRVKLATELAKKATGRTFYVLDEPTSGLHFADIENLLRVLMKLRDAGNTLVVIEHNLEVIKCADWLIDLGPEGGERGGKIIDAGPPEKIAETAGSYTARSRITTACRNGLLPRSELGKCCGRSIEPTKPFGLIALSKTIRASVFRRVCARRNCLSRNKTASWRNVFSMARRPKSRAINGKNACCMRGLSCSIKGRRKQSDCLIRW